MKELIIEAVDPRDLQESDIVGIHEVMQDMWASEEGLGELVQCTHCQKMISKEDVFGNLSEEIKTETVAHIMRIFGVDKIPCTTCGSETRFIYGHENIDKVRTRFRDSVDSFLVLCKDESRIVGFEEAYIDSIPRIFELDLADHYGNIGITEIQKRVDTILGYTPDEIFLFSAIGLLKPYRNFGNLFGMLSTFAGALPERYLGTPGLTELNRGGVTHKINASINQGTSLGIEDDPILREKIVNKGEKYNSDLIVCENPVRVYKDNFTRGTRHFLQSMRGQKSSNATPIQVIEKTY